MGRSSSDKLYFVGFDAIDGKLMEINCVSLNCIPRINQLTGLRLECKFIDFIEQLIGTGVCGSSLKPGLIWTTYPILLCSMFGPFFSNWQESTRIDGAHFRMIPTTNIVLVPPSKSYVPRNSTHFR
ncbi:hypothetical protein [Desulfosarcina sp.]|uniref:hypothetical protein n=1 Tax=Desulfosarcina sp. TaxID=2027861 RepID=UPI0039B95E21